MKALLTTIALATLASAAFAESATYSVDPTHTGVTFEAVHFGTSTLRGRFDKKEGSVELDRAAKTGKVDITIDTTSIDTGVPALDKHLSSPDFFNVAQNPSAHFVGDKFVFKGDKVSEVVGTLTMMGKTQAVTLKANNFNCYNSPLFKREVCGGDFETTIQRSQWGMSYGVANGLPDNIRLLVQVEAVKQ